MNNTISGMELNLFYVVLGIIGIPLLLGFLTEAGKDIYNSIRKKKNYDDFMNTCQEIRGSCSQAIREEIKEIRTDNDFMMGRQNKLRDEQGVLAMMDRTLVQVKEQVKTIFADVKEVRSDIKNIEYMLNVGHKDRREYDRRDE